MKIRAKTAFNYGEPVKMGDELDLADEAAQSLIDHGLAESADPIGPTTISQTTMQVEDEPAETKETKPVGKSKKK